MKLPKTQEQEVMFTIAEVAKLMGWRTERVRRWLVKRDAVTKDGRYFYTCRSMLRRAFPSAWEDLTARLES